MVRRVGPGGILTEPNPGGQVNLFPSLPASFIPKREVGQEPFLFPSQLPSLFRSFPTSLLRDVCLRQRAVTADVTLAVAVGRHDF